MKKSNFMIGSLQKQLRESAMFRILISLVFLIAASFSAQAQTLKKDFARCVQNQLNALGQKVGRADGVPGRATLRGYNALRSQEGYENLPEEFDTQAIIFTCRYLGDKEAELKKFWPASKRSFAVATDQKVPLGIVTYIQQSMPVIHRRFAAFNMQYASSVNIHVFRDKAAGKGFYLNNAAGETETATANFEALHQFHCSNGSVGGWSENNNIYICLNYAENDTNILSDLAAFQQSAFVEHQFKFQEVITGEMFHVSQRELLSAFVLEEADLGRLAEAKTLEPLWLYEGAAQYFEFRFGGLNKREAGYYAELGAQLKFDLRKLSQFEEVSSDLSQAQRTGNLGDVAAFQLQNGRDLKLFHAYFKALGLGTPWKQAFEEVFGMSFEEFYSKF